MHTTLDPVLITTIRRSDLTMSIGLLSAYYVPRCEFFVDIWLQSLSSRRVSAHCIHPMGVSLIAWRFCVSSAAPYYSLGGRGSNIYALENRNPVCLRGCPSHCLPCHTHSRQHSPGTDTGIPSQDQNRSFSWSQIPEKDTKARIDRVMEME